MMYLKKFDLQEMYINQKEDVLKKLAMLIYLRDGHEFKYQDIYLDKETLSLIFGTGLTQLNKSTYDINNIVSILNKVIARTTKLFDNGDSNTFAEDMIKLINTPWITFHVGSKTYTMHWDNINDIYLIFRDFNYYKQSLSVVHEQLKGILK